MTQETLNTYGKFPVFSERTHWENYREQQKNRRKWFLDKQITKFL